MRTFLVIIELLFCLCTYSQEKKNNFILVNGNIIRTNKNSDTIAQGNASFKLIFLKDTLTEIYVFYNGNITSKSIINKDFVIYISIYKDTCISSLQITDKCCSIKEIFSTLINEPNNMPFGCKTFLEIGFSTKRFLMLNCSNKDLRIKNLITSSLSIYELEFAYNNIEYSMQYDKIKKWISK